MYQIVKRLAGTDRRQLRLITHQDESVRIAPDDFGQQIRRYHRRLVEDHRGAGEGLEREAVVLAHPPEHAVYCGGVVHGGLAETRGGFAGEGAEADCGAGKGIAEGVDKRGLAGPRRAVDDGEAAVEGELHGVHLRCVEVEVAHPGLTRLAGGQVRLLLLGEAVGQRLVGEVAWR